MTANEAKKAKKEGNVICFIEEPKLKGIITCLSDDESTVYYKPIDLQDKIPYWLRESAALDKIRIA